MARPRLSSRYRKRRPPTARLALEPLEDRTLPSAMALIPQPIHFSAVAVQRLDAFLNTTTIQTSHVARVTAAELAFFAPLQSQLGGADQQLVDSILTKLEYIDSHPQINLADAVRLRTYIDALLRDQPQLAPRLDLLLKPFPAPAVTLPLASAIERTLGVSSTGGRADEQKVPFTFLVNLVRAARDITNDLFTTLDLLWVSPESLSPGESVLFTAPVNGRLLVQRPLDSSNANDLAVFIATGEPAEVPLEARTDVDGFQLEVPVTEGATYVLRADLGDGKGHYNLTLALVFGGPPLDSVIGLTLREPENSASPGVQPTTLSSPSLAADLAAPLAAGLIVTQADPGGEDTPAPGSDGPGPNPPGGEAPLDRLPGGVDEMLERYRPPVRRQENSNKPEKEALSLPPPLLNGPNSSDPGGADDGFGSSPPVAFWDEPLAGLAELIAAPAPLPDAAAVDLVLTSSAPPAVTEGTPVLKAEEAPNDCVLPSEERLTVWSFIPCVVAALLIERALVQSRQREVVR